MIKSNSNNPVVTKKELIDILYQKNIEGKKTTNFNKEITKIDISNIIDIIIELEDEDNKIYCFREVFWSEQLKKITNGIDLSIDFMCLYYFKVDDNKYIYINPPESSMEKDVIKQIDFFINQIDYILDKNLNEGKKDDYLKLRKSEYIKIRAIAEEQKKTLDVKFKEYDYIKVISENNDYNDIAIKDINKCIDFLNYHTENDYLTIEEQILLRLIILLGIRNIYLNNTDYYKEKYLEDINHIMENISHYILFIKENMDNIKDEDIYSINKKYSFNLFKFLHNKDSYKYVVNKDGLLHYAEMSLYDYIELNSSNNFVPLLRYINFDYYVSIGKFDEAKKIYEMDLPLFKYLKKSEYDAKHMIDELLSDTDNKVLPFNRNIKVILKFYISCYYYFKHFKDNENANKVYEYLLYFKNGYNIEDFIIKCKYFKMAEDICELKSDDINNVEKIDEAVELIDKKITEMKIINKFDVDDVIISYPHIKFDNLDERVKKYIATGDKIINTFYNNKNIEFDYSSAVIEWSKAVELEINNKFISKIAKYKYGIETYSRKINPNKDKNFVLNTKNATIGIYKAISDYNLQDYLYDEYFSKLYTFDKNTYNELCQYIREISETRNDSAHKDKSIDVGKANDCKDTIMASAKILEILSKLEEIC